MSVLRKFVKISGGSWQNDGSILPPGNADSGGFSGGWPDAMAVAEDGTIVTSYINTGEVFVHLDGDPNYIPAHTLYNPDQDGRAASAVGIGTTVIVTQGTEGPAQVWAQDDSGWEFVEMIGDMYFENNGVFVSPDDKTVILSHASEQGPIEVFTADGTGEFNAEQTITLDRDEPVFPLSKWKFMGAGGYQLILSSVYRDPSLDPNIYKYSDPVAFIYSQQPPAPETMFWWKSLIYASQTEGPAPKVDPGPGPGPGPDLPVAPSLPAWADDGTPRGSLVNLSIVDPGSVARLAGIGGIYGEVMYTNGQGVGGLLVTTYNSLGQLVGISSEEDNELYEMQYQVGDILVPMVWFYNDEDQNWKDIDTYPTVRVDSVSVNPFGPALDSQWQPYDLKLVTDGILPDGAVDGTYNIPVLPAAGQLGTGALYRETIVDGQFANYGYIQVLEGFANFDQGYLTGELYKLDLSVITGITEVGNQYVQIGGMYLMEDDEGGGGFPDDD